ncbi:MAG: histone deacetylase family protein [Gammaproteobacteria bacterium]
MTTGFVYDSAFLEHDTGQGHPETSARLVSAMQFLEQQPWFGDMPRFAPAAADRKWIQQVHSDGYIARAQAACRAGHSHLDVLDVAISPESFDTALLAAGAALELGDKVMAGEVDNGFALVRPPGHHAEQDAAMGFCLFNNVAILARYLQHKHGVNKVMILDWDVHHGNGTQHTFEADPSVLYISTHQYPYYPGTGAASETGTGRGQGATLNCPMSAGSMDADYELAWTERIVPKINDFKPEVVIISAGFDAHEDDPLAQMNLSTGFFGWMSERMMEMADQHAGARLISLLEGGYNLQMLPRCIGEHLTALMKT